VHCLLPNENKFNKIERENGAFGFAYFCKKHQNKSKDKFHTMQEIITISKTYQRENIEALEKKKKKKDEDWLNADFFDFNEDEANKTNILNNYEKGEKKSNQDSLFNDYPIKKKKLEAETSNPSKENITHFTPIKIGPIQSPQKRMKKVKKQYSPTTSFIYEKKKKHDDQNYNSDPFKEKHSNSGTITKPKVFIINEKKEKLDNYREKYEISLKKQKQAEKRKFSQKVVKYPNFLDETRET